MSRNFVPKLLEQVSKLNSIVRKELEKNLINNNLSNYVFVGFFFFLLIKEKLIFLLLCVKNYFISVCYIIISKFQILKNVQDWIISRSQQISTFGKVQYWGEKNKKCHSQNSSKIQFENRRNHLAKYMHLTHKYITTYSLDLVQVDRLN